MDKNFISVDDLVRQRLGGEEEKERPGAWLQMRDLLDKEMPRDRGGFLYWRRTFGAIAIALLAASAGLGSYMYATRANNTSVNDAIAANTSSINDHSVNKITTAGSTDLAANNTDAKSTTAENAAVKHTAAHKAAHDLKSSNTADNNIADDNATAGNTSTNSPITSANTTKTTNNNEINNTKQLSAALVAGSKQPAHVHTGQRAGENPNDNTATAGVPANTVYKPVTSVSGGSSHKHSAAKTEATKKKEFLAGVVAANDRNKKAAAESRKKEEAKQLAALDTKASAVNAEPLANNAKGGAAHHSSHKTDAPKTGKASAGDIASINGLPTPVTHARKAIADNKGQTVSADKLALGSSATGTKNTPVTNSAKPAGTNGQPVAGNNSKPGNATTRASKQGTGNGTGNSPDKNKTSTGSRSATAQGPATATPSEHATAKRETVPYDRVNIVGHFVGTSPKEGYYKYDTISIEQLARELGMNTGTNGSAHHPEEARKEENGNSTSSSNAVASANAPVVPESSASATGKNGLGTKQTQASKGSGETTLDKLNATFNDVKYHVTGMQFAPGLTGGINATFFGPNSFKGFQFGVTGNFSFGDNVSAMAEVKYFHRINNNYSLNDNYYTYTPVSAGQWSRQQLSNSYSFSTLHSIEMPITLRFIKSHFSFYAGANLVYSFAINTGKSEPPSTVSPVLVSAMGNDNTPKVQQSDFNSRFGVGYIAGLSYEVYPNVTLDFRNVQTVWDNGSSQGAKFISNQLYKSPSFQVSVGYRLGGNKKKD